MRRILLALLIAILAIGTAFASGQDEATGAGDAARAEEMREGSGIPGFEFADHIIDAVENGEELEIRFVHQDVSLEFAQVIGTGVVQAGEDFGVDAEFTGSTNEQAVEDMVAIIENLITRRVDGLAIANVNPDALNPLIDRAIEAGIPTITAATGAPGSRAFAFVGQDLYASGFAQGDIIAEYMEEEGQLIIFSVSVAAQWSIQREAGLRDALAQYPGIEVLGIFESGIEDQQVYATLENAVRANPDLAAVATLDAVTSPVMGRVLRRLDRADIVHVGHDLQAEALQNVADGYTKALLSQDPFRQGYTAVELLVDFIRNGDVPTNVDTGVLRVDSSNAQELLDRLEAGEPVG